MLVVDSASHGQIAVDADGRNYRVITHFDPSEGLPQWANWAPDGKRLVIQAGRYNRQKVEDSTAHLWLVDAPPAKPRSSRRTLDCRTTKHRRGFRTGSASHFRAIAQASCKCGR